MLKNGEAQVESIYTPVICRALIDELINFLSALFKIKI